MVPVSSSRRHIAVRLHGLVEREGQFYTKRLGWVQAGYYADWSNSVTKSGDAIVFLPPKVILQTFGHTNWPAVKLASARQLHPPRIMVGLACACFYFFALGHQILCYAFGMWIAGKIIFMIMVLFVAMRSLDPESKRGGRRSPLQVRLTFDDERKRFGFASLDRAYDAAAMILLAVAIGVMLQINNSAKDYVGYGTDAALFGRLLSLLIPGLVLLTIFLLPIVIFGGDTADAKTVEYPGD